MCIHYTLVTGAHVTSKKRHTETCSGKSKLTIATHAQRQTFLQTAVLAAVAIGSVNKAVPLPGAGVHSIVLLTSAEEALNE